MPTQIPRSGLIILAVAALAVLALDTLVLTKAHADDIQLLLPDNNVSSQPFIEYRARAPYKENGIKYPGHVFIFLGRELDNGTSFYHQAYGF